MTDTVELNLSDLRDTMERMAAVLKRQEADAKALRFYLSEAVAYADANAEMEGMPAGKQCKRLTSTVIESGVSVTKVFDVSGSRDILQKTEYLRR